MRIGDLVCGFILPPGLEGTAHLSVMKELTLGLRLIRVQSSRRIYASDSVSRFIRVALEVGVDARQLLSLAQPLSIELSHSFQRKTGWGLFPNAIISLRRQEFLTSSFLRARTEHIARPGTRWGFAPFNTLTAFTIVFVHYHNGRLWTGYALRDPFALGST
ncbi:hypothetical protein CC2G_014923 [Coprinopsis cinerea AmutBmut pab1-1]|nr:hypothetical protein CC2G_014923 [Coprinopsis cinerea AmutBmut pab1-1]